MTFDEAKDNIISYKKLLGNYKDDNLSESDTRSKIIDSILINLLGWDEHDIIREGHIDSGFYDYRLSIAGFNVIIEAKKQYCEFKIPNLSKKSVKLKSIYEENKSVFDQIRNYLSDVGCDTGIITNGRQFIIAKLINNNGVSWKDNKCIIFNGLEEIEKNFIEFWNCLSKESIIKNGGINILQISDLQFSKTILSTIPDKDNEITRNDIASKIAPIISKIFGQIYNYDNSDNDMDFIKECYVENKEVIKNKAELNGLFCDNAPPLNGVIKARNQESIIKQINSSISTKEEISRSVPTPKPIIIIGTRGAGKTTFINFLFERDSKDNTITKFPYVYINLMKYYEVNKNLDFELIANDAISLFSQKYPEYDIYSTKVLKRIYIKEINNNDKGIWSFYKTDDVKIYNEKLSIFFEQKLSNNIEHLKALNLYLTKEIHKRIILVFDNADQLNDDIQEKVFLYACSLNVNARFGVFISLREGYYYKWRTMPPFNAFDSFVYHIASPDYGLVLQKRINYAIKCINEKNSNISGVTSDGKNLQIQGGQIAEFFEGIRNSLFGEYDSPILEFIRFNTFPNIREGLNLFKTFLISGYTDVDEYILRVIFNNRNNTITIPIHEFAKTIGLENKKYYNHSTSLINNLFYPKNNNRDYFIKIWLLKRFEEQFQGNLNKFISYNQLVEEFKEYGYKEDLINQELEYLISNGFIDTDSDLADIKWTKLPDENFSMTIMAKGLFYIQTMICKFYYWELITQDTPIFNLEIFNELKILFPIIDNKGKRDLKMRLDFVNKFIEHLKSQEQQMQPSALRQKYGLITDYIMTNGLKQEMDLIMKKVNIKNV